MTDHHFQLTYSVHPINNDSNGEQAAEKARRKIREIEGFETLENIETTLVGILELASVTQKEKRREAEKLISGEISKKLREFDVYHDVTIYSSLMIDGLGEHIEFTI